ncbi:MAG: ATP-binding cassette domain-containing protein [Elusimicrobia bacterium]|nr:ATP-binding cassette domain-containing protein [Elusimicrobiota bacterium]
MDAIRLEGVQKGFGGPPAVKRLSWRVPEGAVYGLIGPNGSGKTTTIRMILDIFPPDEGTIEVFGRRPDASTRDRVGYLPEERGLYKRMRVRDVLVYLGRLKGRGGRALATSISNWLERLGLTAWADKPVEELSKGMQQKVQFVGTVLHEPKLLFLDEPFSGLDPISADLLKDAVLELRRRGSTIVLSTHVMEAAEKLCDSVLMLHRGGKVLDGPLADIRHDHGADAVTLDYEGDGASLKDLPGVASVNDYGRHAELTLASGADPQAVLRALLDRVKVHRYEARRSSLHEIFRRRVEGPVE